MPLTAPLWTWCVTAAGAAIVFCGEVSIENLWKCTKNVSISKNIKTNIREIPLPKWTGNIPEKKKSAFWKLANDGWLTDWGIDEWFFRGEEKAEPAEGTAGTKKSKSANKSEVFDSGTDDSGTEGIAETTGRATGEDVTVDGWAWTGWEDSPFIPFSLAAGRSVSVLGSAYHLHNNETRVKKFLVQRKKSWQFPFCLFTSSFRIWQLSDLWISVRLSFPKKAPPHYNGPSKQVYSTAEAKQLNQSRTSSIEKLKHFNYFVASTL